MKEENVKTEYPFIYEKNWWKLRDTFQKKLPQKVDVKYLKETLNNKSDGTMGSLFKNLQKIKLIDDEGKPTDRANRWRIDSSYNEVCDEIIKNIYPEEFLKQFPKGSYKEYIKNYFMQITSTGDQMSSYLANFYLLLLDQDITKKQKDVKKGTKIKGKKIPIIAESNGYEKEVSQDKVEIQQNTEQKLISEQIPEKYPKDKINPKEEFPKLHIDIQIHIDANASKEQIDAVFESMRKHLYKSS